ncbi:MAG TPA: hypothetical protein VGR22_04875 [Thermomicrobiales bacterium]|nr:hypothetical protein [Thermomicrobiales bacterium]
MVGLVILSLLVLALIWRVGTLVGHRAGRRPAAAKFKSAARGQKRNRLMVLSSQSIRVVYVNAHITRMARS